MKSKPEPELLSPAGGWEALTAAVQNGADAVYMGGNQFNARRLADNFDREALRKAIQYAHLYGVRIYVTVNILIKEKEWEELESFLKELEEFAADGVIVQDLGAARYIAQNHPNLALHASTQMTIHQLEGVRILEDMGFCRIVPARELTLEELKYISENSGLELETFIHGALCVSYSGQCLMSSMLGGRSGNRGMCAQPCRLAYNLDKGKNSKGRPTYPISMKDLSTLDFLEEILDAGVTSLKIEGRMKRAEYVAVVTREYRKALDSIRDTGHYRPDGIAEEKLLQIFNRGGFTKGYYYGTDHEDRYAREKPNHWGIYLGKVRKVDGSIVWIALEDNVETGDGIEFWMKGSGSRGQLVSPLLREGRKVDRGSKGQLVGIRSSVRPEPGTPVYRTSKASQRKEAEASYRNIYNRKIPVSAVASFRIGRNPALALRDTDGTLGKASSEYIVQPARKNALTEEEIRLHLNKLGDTPFAITDFALECDKGIFLPVSLLNQLRREAARNLTEKRIAYYDRKAALRNSMVWERRGKSREEIGEGNGETGCSRVVGAPVAPGSGKYADCTAECAKAYPTYASDSRTVLNGYVDRLDVFPESSPECFRGLDVVSYAPRSFSFAMDALREQVEPIRKSGIAVRLVLPSITRRSDMEWLRSLDDGIWTMFDGYQLGNLGQVLLLREKGVKNCFGGDSLNVTNTWTIAQLRDLGLKGVVLSPELTTAEIHDIIKRSCLPCEILVYGRIRLMTLEYCPHATDQNSCGNCRFMGEHTLTDRMGYEFPLRKRRISRCYTELLNSLSIFLADNMDAFHKLSVAAWGLQLEGLAPEERKQVILSYRYALDHPGGSLPEDLAAYAEAVKKSGFTKGHFFRGVE